MPTEAARENEKVYNFYRYASRGAAALAALFLTAAYITSPDEGFENTPEFESRKYELRAQFQSACEQEAPARNQSIQECIEASSHNAAVNAEIGLANRIFSLLSVTCGFQAAGLRIGQSTAGRRLRDMRRDDNPPSP